MKTIKYIGIFVLIIILFRGYLYRKLVNYSNIRVKQNITITNKNLIKKINDQVSNKVLTIQDIINISNEITSSNLDFTFKKNSVNPNIIFNLKKTNCIGYSSLFNSIGNYIIKKQKMNKNYEFIHLTGKLDVLGFDIHKLFDSPFFKDHDFNEIKNKLTGEHKFVDPSLRDYLRIEYVTSK